jgi:hypothetical protein
VEDGVKEEKKDDEQNQTRHNLSRLFLLPYKREVGRD